MRSPDFGGQGSSLGVSLKKEPPVPPVIPPLKATFTPGIDKPAVSSCEAKVYQKWFSFLVSRIESSLALHCMVMLLC